MRRYDCFSVNYLVEDNNFPGKVKHFIKLTSFLKASLDPWPNG